MNKQRTKRNGKKPDLIILPGVILILLILFLSLFQLPFFSPQKISAVSGMISNISVEHSSFGKSKRQVLYFDLDQCSYYFPLTNVVKRGDLDLLLASLRDCEGSRTPVTIEVTAERDYRDLLFSNGRAHAITLRCGSQNISIDAYKKDVAFLRTVLLLFAGLLMLPVLFLLRLDRMEQAGRRRAKKRQFFR